MMIGPISWVYLNFLSRLLRIQKRDFAAVGLKLCVSVVCVVTSMPLGPGRDASTMRHPKTVAAIICSKCGAVNLSERPEKY
jgi:hypothetical protein